MVINIHNSGDKQKNDSESGESCSSGTCGNGLENIYPTAAVRYGYRSTVGEFKYPSPNMRFGCGVSVVIQTTRGIEIGELVSLTCDGCDKCVSREQIQRYVDASGPEHYQFGNGKILRLATPEDLTDWEHIRAETARKKVFCQERADKHGLEMKVRECEHLFGGERIIFFFMSEGRVDFRGLVKELADEFQTRIEMRQVGARDEARLLADYETCGRECCCKNFLKTLKPISMKMAKMQKATLDPAKVSGRCGRLKCCLRYEHVTYEELDQGLPKVGAKVVTEEGAGTIVARQILTQLLHIQTEGGGRLTVPVEAILSEAEIVKLQAKKEEAAKAAAAAPEFGSDKRSPFRSETSSKSKKAGKAGRGRSRSRQARKKTGTTNAEKKKSPRESQKDISGQSSGRETPGEPPKGDDGGGQGGKPKRRRRRGRRSSQGRDGKKTQDGERGASPPVS